MLGKKIKNKKIGLKPSLTKKQQHFYVISRKKLKLMEIIKILSNYVIENFNGNTKVRLHEFHQGNYVHTIPNFSEAIFYSSTTN